VVSVIPARLKTVMAPRQFLEFRQEIADIICERLAGGETLRDICKDDDMPSNVTVYKWVQLVPTFASAYARARELQADTYFDDIVHVAKTPFIGTKKKTTTAPNGVTIEISEGDMVDHRRLQMDALKWAAGKMRPKNYGDRAGSSDADESGRNEVNIRVTGGYVEAFDKKSDE
jgi:hypothetical protein